MNISQRVHLRKAYRAAPKVTFLIHRAEHRAVCSYERRAALTVLSSGGTLWVFPGVETPGNTLSPCFDMACSVTVNFNAEL